MKTITPEQAGIRSEAILEYVKLLEENRLATHDIIIARHGEILYENYWAPFHENYLHRMYSVSKSFVSLAIGFLEQDGLIALDDPISKYFPKELANQPDQNMHNQTIRHMLMMSTAKPVENWFQARHADRVQQYFDNKLIHSRPSGTVWEYDSSGSFIMGALVERLVGMPFMDYLRGKMFNKIGVSKEAYCLRVPGGHSWGDSAVLCTARDLLKVAQFTLNKGAWDGEQILNAEYVTAATSKQIDNSFLVDDEADSQGYGYQFWRTYDNSWFFNGMGCQFAICVPDSDIVFVYNADNQGKDYAKKTVIDNFFKMIVRPASKKPLPANDTALEELKEYSASRKLAVAIGSGTSPIVKKVDRLNYEMNDNAMGITKMCFEFHGNSGVLRYTNAQGDKVLPFGMLYNEFGPFPQDGYSDLVGSVPGAYRYQCAASAAWLAPDKLHIKVQIIDKYFGVLNILVGFQGDRIGVEMKKTAEDFLDEYQGFAAGDAVSMSF